MNCNEFQKRLEADVNGGREVRLTAEMLKHNETCPACREYARGLIEFVRMVNDRPPVDVPAGFEDIAEIVIALASARRSRRDWLKDLRRGAIYLLVVAALWLAGFAMARLGSFTIHALVTIAATCVLALRSKAWVVKAGSVK